MLESLTSAEIPRDATFDLPEGTFAAKIKTVKPQMKQSKDKPNREVKFILDVNVPSITSHECMAARAFALNYSRGSDLRNFLTPLLGEEFFIKHAGKKFDARSLEGMGCRVVLSHAHNPAYKNPLVVVENLLPPSSEPVSEEAKKGDKP